MRAARPHDRPEWAALLVDAVQTPGVISAAFKRFWRYSAGNQLLAYFTCLTRGLEPGPLHTFKGWLDLGRHVRKGEKAITLCMPVRVKAKACPGRTPGADTNGTTSPPLDEEDDGTKTVFTFKPHWFVLSQTEGAPYAPTELPAWSEAAALRGLAIEHVPFTHPDGNCQGFAHGRQVSVSPIAAEPHTTLFHEVAHVVLGHTAKGMCEDHARTPPCLREVEAECVALLCAESLGLPGAAACRGYVQHWLRKARIEAAIPERSAQRIFKATDAILKAGLPPGSVAPAESPPIGKEPARAQNP